MKVSSAAINVNIYPKQLNFRSEQTMTAPQVEQDKFVRSKEKKRNITLPAACGLAIIGIGAIFAHKAGRLGKTKAGNIIYSGDFKSIKNAKEYFESLGIEIDFRGATNEHLPMLNRIKENIKQLKEMGVKKDIPDSITISDWSKREETKELFQKRGSINEEPPKSGYYKAFSLFGRGKNEESHIIIDSNSTDFDRFRHEMGHINHHRGLDSYWHSKGLKEFDFAENQLKILGSDEKILHNVTSHPTCHRNIIEVIFNSNVPSKYGFVTSDGEVRYIYTKSLTDRMQRETHAYDNGKDLAEQIAYVFEGLLSGGKFSDEVMLYYDFAGGARIPNLKINGKTYDEYIESLYNNPELIQKLRENVKISKL